MLFKSIVNRQLTDDGQRLIIKAHLVTIAHFAFYGEIFTKMNKRIFLNADFKEIEAKANTKPTHITLRKRFYFRFSINKKKQLNHFNSLKRYISLWVMPW